MRLLPPSWCVVAAACSLACAGRSEHTSPGSAGDSSLGGTGGTGVGGASAGRGGGGAAGANAGIAGTPGVAGSPGAAGAAGAPPYAALPVCLQPAESGPCDAYFERYAFNPETLNCERFVFGGCGGNDNNFESAVDCEATCTSQYFECDPASRGKGCPCNDARDCASGSCSNAIYELTMNGYPDCPPSPIGICTGSGAESCTCPIQGGNAFCAP